MLNASRRHRLGHLRARVAWTSGQYCAQRLSASQTWSRRRPGSWGDRFVGAQRLSASQTWSHRGHGGGYGYLKCSTPLGVTDLVTGRHSAEKTGGKRAQRLSASQTWSQPLELIEWQTDFMCSTPLGVTDLVTTPRGAGRSGCGCAQRLSASQTWSPLVAPAADELAETCSTPLGVTDLVTLWLSVLTRTVSACSTPLGVTDLVTRAGWPGRGPRGGAQRLSASQTWSPRAGEADRDRR